MHTLHILMRPDEMDGGFIAECPEIPGCISQGETEEQALANIKEAIDLCLEVRREVGLPLTVPVPPQSLAVGDRSYTRR
jgi:predicted RNase H-like HicB family nuclease